MQRLQLCGSDSTAGADHIHLFILAGHGKHCGVPHCVPPREAPGGKCELCLLHAAAGSWPGSGACSWCLPTRQPTGSVQTSNTGLARTTRLVLRLLQKRNEAWRRYCKLRTQGKLEGGNNPTLAASDSGFGGVSSAEEQLRGGCSDDEVVGLGSAAGSKQRHRSSFNCGPCFGSGPQPQAANGEHTAADFMPQVEQRKQPFKLFFRAPQVGDWTRVECD